MGFTGAKGSCDKETGLLLVFQTGGQNDPQS